MISLFPPSRTSEVVAFLRRQQLGQLGCGGIAAIAAGLLAVASGWQPAWGAVPLDLEDSSSPLEEQSSPPSAAEARAAVVALLAARSNLPSGDRVRVARAIVEESSAAQLDPVFILAVIGVESELDGRAVSRRGARGLMQLRDLTTAFLGEKEQMGLGAAAAGDPALNVRVGVRYLRRLQRAFGDLSLALVAYNVGPHRISGYLHDHRRLPPQFTAYPRRVRSHYHRLLGELAQGSLRVDHPLAIRVAER